MTEPLDYYDPAGLSAVFYDMVCRLDSTTHGDPAYYARFVASGGSALDLGCGTGRIAVDLAARGVDVVGVDLSQPMLYRAARRLTSLPAETAARVSLVQADMTEVDLGRRFDLVFVAFFGLAHLPPEFWTRAFEAIRRHMDAETTAIVHLPDPALMGAPPADRDPLMPLLSAPYTARGDTLNIHLAAHHFDGERFEQLLDYVLRDPDGVEVRRSRERLTYHVADPVPLAASAGLALAADPEPLGAGQAFRFGLG